MMYSLNMSFLAVLKYNEYFIIVRVVYFLFK